MNNFLLSEEITSAFPNLLFTVHGFWDSVDKTYFQLYVTSQRWEKKTCPASKDLDQTNLETCLFHIDGKGSLHQKFYIYLNAYRGGKINIKIIFSAITSG
jgi:hypothetical protein